MAVLLYRIQNYFYGHGFLLLAYVTHRANFFFHGIDIVPGAQIGAGLRIEHPHGIVIGGKVSIGKNFTILQNVTLGTRYIDEDNYNDLFPVIGDNVFIGCNSSVLGGVVVKNKSVIGAHSLVLKDVDEESRVYGLHK
jgi:serine O-acetyltransferase